MSVHEFLLIFITLGLAIMLGETLYRRYAPKKSAKKRISILALSDEPFDERIVNSLKKNEVDLNQMTDAVKAMMSIAENKPDLIILDIDMPMMEGFQVVDQLKGQKDIKIILVSAKQDAKDSYLLKPIAEEDLLVVIQDFRLNDKEIVDR